MAISIVNTNHFAVSVSDFDRSIEWYERVLGFKLLCRNIIEPISTPVAHLDSPDSGFMLEIFCPPDSLPVPEDRKMPNTDMRTQGNKHFSLTIEDHEQTLLELEELEVPVVFTSLAWGTYCIFIHDPDGNLIELFEGDMRDKANV